MSQPSKHTGEKFNRLTIVRRYIVQDVPVKHRYYCECLCDCGKTWRGQIYSVTSGGTKSCGCLLNEERHRKFKKTPIVKMKPLSEITEKECAILYESITHTPNHDVSVSFTSNSVSMKRNFSDPEEEFLLYFDGEIDKPYPRYMNEFQIVKEILKMGYDVI